MSGEYQNDYKKSIEDPEAFWLEQAKMLNWFEPPKKGITKLDNGHRYWFEGGKLNTSYLALDYHVENGRAEQNALIYDSPVTGVKEHYTYATLLERVSKTAGALKKLGVKKGDTVVIYMPAIPQAVISMLACARLGAIHSVVFGGFASKELAIRIDDAKPKVVISASCGVEVKKIISYKPLLDEALEMAEHKVESTLIFQRPQVEAEMIDGRDFDFAKSVDDASLTSYVTVDATDPLYILYTSGTTGKPKGIVRHNGGHAVALNYSMKYVYDIDPGDVFWAASDVGWVVGHSYIVYAPLIYGATTILFEGKPIKTPDASSFWRVIAEHNVKAMFTAPTAIRAIRKEDPEGKLMKKYDLSGLKYQFLAGERCDEATYNWLKEKLNIPVIDHWWQTESGWAMIANMAGYGVNPTKPGSVSLPVCGYDLRIVKENGDECKPNEEGLVVVKLPLPPSCLATIWKNDERFQKGYLDKVEGYYFSGDGGYKDEDGYVFITGRIDDVINVAGHRLSTAEIEEVVAMHPAVAECAVVGADDELKGQIPVAFIVCNARHDLNDIAEEIIQDVRHEVGAIANLKTIYYVDRLPKTRSGKTLRKTLRSIVNGEDYSMPSTIDDPQILSEIEQIVEQHKIR
ncbi:MAG: acetate--CoA ligase [Salibacter sp.]|uniref:acetate--CoA ligase n=1 Tax=Salibacter sp. TaxID=2010995 RepID=UPI0028706206|nr:acetate--CoA ligase [Salibacter sp.]MDR9398312.1 acetate--CoA ligase [Salibacter sp.]